MKKASILIVIILLLSTILVSAASAQGEPLVINLWQQDTYMIVEGDEVVIRARWGACSPGLVQSFISASEWGVTLEGETLLTPNDVHQLWGPIEIIENPPPAYDVCVGKAKPAIAYWTYTLPALEEGGYEIDTHMTVSHPVIDGGDYDGDGKPDRFTSENLQFNSVNYLGVLPASP